jgi:ectoine hydroxylase-related dioxygenase (phytanoyl-CoA dioxygenase family)
MNLLNEKIHYLDNGFAVLRNIIVKSDIDTLVAEAERVRGLANLNKLRDIHLVNGRLSSMHNLADYSDFYKFFIQSSIIQDFFYSVYGSSSSKIFNSSFFAKPKRDGLETKAHQDNAYFCMDSPQIMTCWFPVNFSDSRNGTLYYYSKSDVLGNIPHSAEGNLGASMCINSSHIKNIAKKFVRHEINLSKGDCVVHNPLVVHGSNANLSEFDRKAFNFSIASSKAKRLKSLYQNYQNQLQNFLVQKK